MKNKKKTSPASVLMTVLMVTTGIIGGILSTRYFERLPEDVLTAAGLFRICIMALCAFYVSIILHEGGHLVFGLLSGYRFRSFRIASIVLIKINGSLKLKRHSVMGTGGQCLMDLPEGSDGQIPYRLYHMGGVIFNLIFGIGSAALAIFTPIGLDATAFFTELALFNIAFAFTNGIPVASGGIINDGANALYLHKDPFTRHVLNCQLKINSLQSDGVSLSDMSDELFPLPEAEELTNSIRSSTVSIYVSRLICKGEFEEALRVAERYKGVTQMHMIHRAFLNVDRATLLMLNRARGGEVDACIDPATAKVIGAMASIPSMLRFNYLYATLISYDEQKRALYKKKFEKLKKSYPYTADLKDEETLLLLADSIREENT